MRTIEPWAKYSSACRIEMYHFIREQGNPMIELPQLKHRLEVDRLYRS